MNFDALYANVHGGLTLSGFMRDFQDYEDEVVALSSSEGLGDDWWVFGFDTVHAEDNPEKWNEKSITEETLELQRQLESETVVKDMLDPYYLENIKAQIEELKQKYDKSFSLIHNH